ncbi:NADH-dependent phenylglyoxylate dehydrogenase subunit epsilon [Rhodospirillaceae bacterium LM-1]|nr:NADH-dependent phenylglyoxylate dehydrogenase subunit epsilon [Rhodospirillaceae bacterium LM-1]
MQDCTYLIVGSSHAGLTALDAIRMIDPEAPLIMATREDHLPYSPTVLPYVVSGRSIPKKVALRDEDYFKRQNVAFLRNAELKSLDVAASTARFEGGANVRYEKLLLATGAQPSIPPIPGLKDAFFHVLRTMDDALNLKSAMGSAKSALVLGAGLIGTHAAENMAEAGVKVTIVEAKGQVLPGYFDKDASALIETAFRKHGIALEFGRSVKEIKQGRAVLEDGAELPFDLLLIATGVRPQLSFLDGTGVKTANGIMVDEMQRTSAANVWAAGDCAEARMFQAQGTGVAGILPIAVEQGRIAGQAMVGDHGVKAFPGSVLLNTYSFFGQQAISVGIGEVADGETCLRIDEAAGTYLKIVLKDGKLMGVASVNNPIDPGILWQLILRRTDLSEVKDRFLADPKAVGRMLMSRLWR